MFNLLSPALVCVSAKVELKTRVWVQVVDVGGDNRKLWLRGGGVREGQLWVNGLKPTGAFWEVVWSITRLVPLGQGARKFMHQLPSLSDWGLSLACNSPALSCSCRCTQKLVWMTSGVGQGNSWAGIQSTCSSPRLGSKLFNKTQSSGLLRACYVPGVCMIDQLQGSTHTSILEIPYLYTLKWCPINICWIAQYGWKSMHLEFKLVCFQSGFCYLLTVWTQDWHHGHGQKWNCSCHITAGVWAESFTVLYTGMNLRFCFTSWWLYWLSTELKSWHLGAHLNTCVRISGSNILPFSFLKC